MSNKPWTLWSANAALKKENAVLQELINDVAKQINSMGTSVTVKSFGNALLNKIDAARKE
jgi:hypothetical protein